MTLTRITVGVLAIMLLGGCTDHAGEGPSVVTPEPVFMARDFKIGDMVGNRRVIDILPHTDGVQIAQICQVPVLDDYDVEGCPCPSEEDIEPCVGENPDLLPPCIVNCKSVYSGGVTFTKCVALGYACAHYPVVYGFQYCDDGVLTQLWTDGTNVSVRNLGTCTF